MTKRTVKTQSKTPQPELDFETAMAQLEEIVESIESGAIGLERSLAEYEKGVQLIARCKSILQNAEQRVETLRQSAPGDDDGVARGGH
jgi:exodeoxyribonuclease VII small subunit